MQSPIFPSSPEYLRQNPQSLAGIHHTKGLHEVQVEVLILPTTAIPARSYADGHTQCAVFDTHNNSSSAVMMSADVWTVCDSLREINGSTGISGKPMLLSRPNIRC